VASQTQHAILEAALHVFATQGFAAASLRDIATVAGTTHGLIRHHFGTKERLWERVVNAAAQQFAAALTPYAPIETVIVDPVGTARAGIASFMRVAAAHPQIIRLLLHEGTQGGVQLDYALAQFAPLGDMMEPLLEQLQARGHLRQFDNRSFFLFVLLAGCGPFAMSPLASWLVQDDLQRPRAIDAQITRLLDTLLPLPATGA
jgi:AcrR family transcriptional regulator